MTPFDSTGTDDGRKNNFANYLPPMTTATWVTVAASVIVGFTLGLIIAWGIFPVEWTNAWPGDLTQEARAQYLAAVSEAYVYYGDEEAAEIARNRLYDLNENIAEEIAAAQAYFLDNPQRNARVYVNNLGQLAEALNIESPDIIDELPAEGEAGAIVPEPSEGGVGDAVRAWVNWTLTLLAAVLLVGGGIYIIGRLNRRRNDGGDDDYVVDDEPGGFDDESSRFGSPAPGRNPFMRPAGAMPGRAAMPGTAVAASPGARTAERGAGEEYGFEDEDDDGVFSHGRTLTEDEPRGGFEEVGYDETAYVEADYDEADGDEFPATRYERAEVVDDEPTFDAPFVDPDDQDDPTFGQSSVETVDYEEGAFVDPYSEEDFSEDAAADDESVVDEPLVPAATSPRVARRAPADLPVLHSFTVQYQAGMLDYDQSHSILNPEGGRYIGDCGMGINMKNGVLQDNPESVIALDVWLVDKKQDKSYSSQTRVLISEYVVDHDLESAFKRERPNGPDPLVPHPGTKFQLRGPSLLLDCEIVEADYMEGDQNTGIFQNLKIDMTVRSLE